MTRAPISERLRSWLDGRGGLRALRPAAEVLLFAGWFLYFLWPQWSGSAAIRVGNTQHMNRALLEGRYLQPELQRQIRATGALPPLPPTRASGWRSTVIERCATTGGWPGYAWRWCPEKKELLMLDGRGMPMFVEGTTLPVLWGQRGRRGAARAGG